MVDLIMRLTLEDHLGIIKLKFLMYLKELKYVILL